MEMTEGLGASSQNLLLFDPTAFKFTSGRLTILGQRDGSPVKTCISKSEVLGWIHPPGRRELTLASCPVTSTQKVVKRLHSYTIDKVKQERFLVFFKRLISKSIS